MYIPKKLIFKEKCLIVHKNFLSTVYLFIVFQMLSYIQILKMN